ncbi:MAG: ribbon-helix-helix domain-containing protein [Sulfolobus sp.]
MKKVVSVRLREDTVNKINFYVKELGLESRTDFLRQALRFYVEKKKGNV